MTIEELCKRSYDIAVSKGWHEQKRTMGEVIALFHSELSEALECFRDPSHQPGDVWYSGEDNRKPEGIVVELADLLIRICDAAVEMDLRVATCLHNTNVGMLGHGCSDFLLYDGQKLDSFGDMLSLVHIYLSRAFDVSIGNKDHSEVACFLARAMNAVGGICRIFHWDLEKAVVEKIEHNASRSYRHGGKRA
jgi:hypothetical protein